MTVSIKPLEWQRENVDGTFWIGYAPVAGFGEYRVKFNGEAWEAVRGMVLIGTFDTSEAAKSFVNADYDTRIRSALIGIPGAEKGEPVAHRWRNSSHGVVSGWFYSEERPSIAPYDWERIEGPFPLYAAPISERVQASEEGPDAEIVAAVSANFRNDLDRIMADNPPPETGWLIELVSRLGLPPTWFALGGDDDNGFTADSVKALRFARKQDAQAYIDDIGWTECIPTEHEWSEASPKASPRISALNHKSS